MAPRTSKQKGKAAIRHGNPEPPTLATLPVPVPSPIHTEVLEALQALWNQMQEFLVLNSSGPWLAVPNRLEFVRAHLPALVPNSYLLFLKRFSLISILF